MKYAHIGLVGVFAACTACGGQPASIEDVEAKMTEDFSEGDAEVTWIDVVEDEPGEFTVTLDITDPEEETGSRTALCDVSQTTTSSSYSCQSARPSIAAQVVSQIEEFYAGRNVEVTDSNLERTDEGDLAGTITARDPGSGQPVQLNCEVDVQDRSSFDWSCNAG